MVLGMAGALAWTLPELPELPKPQYPTVMPYQLPYHRLVPTGQTPTPQPGG